MFLNPGFCVPNAPSVTRYVYKTRGTQFLTVGDMQTATGALDAFAHLGERTPGIVGNVGEHGTGLSGHLGV